MCGIIATVFLVPGFNLAWNTDLQTRDSNRAGATSPVAAPCYTSLIQFAPDRRDPFVVNLEAALFLQARDELNPVDPEPVRILIAVYKERHHVHGYSPADAGLEQSIVDGSPIPRDQPQPRFVFGGFTPNR